MEVQAQCGMRGVSGLLYNAATMCLCVRLTHYNERIKMDSYKWQCFRRTRPPK